MPFGCGIGIYRKTKTPGPPITRHRAFITRSRPWPATRYTFKIYMPLLQPVVTATATEQDQKHHDQNNQIGVHGFFLCCQQPCSCRSSANCVWFARHHG